MPEQYASVNTYRIGNAEVVVYRPNLTEDERNKREATVKNALASFGRAMINQKMVRKPNVNK